MADDKTGPEAPAVPGKDAASAESVAQLGQQVEALSNVVQQLVHGGATSPATGKPVADDPDVIKRHVAAEYERLEKEKSAQAAADAKAAEEAELRNKVKRLTERQPGPMLNRLQERMFGKA